MTTDAKRSPEDSLQKTKSDYNRAKFWKNKQNSEKFDSETSKLQSVNLSETSGDIAGIHQRATDS